MLKKVKLFFLILFTAIAISSVQIAFAYTIDDLPIYPVCNSDGGIICPKGYEAACANSESESEKSEPKCIFYAGKHVPGCLKFIGIEKLNLDFLKVQMPKSTMIEIVGGGEKYNLNREIVGCRKL